MPVPAPGEDGERRVERAGGVRRVGRYLPPLGDEFISTEALSAIVLFAAAAAAIVWANVDWSSYVDVWHTVLTVGIGDASISLDLQHWINDLLMGLFFFVVGLEIKRELVRGELRHREAAALPVMAAVGGMLVPALVFVALNSGGAHARAWGIPMATDIAFAVGVLALLGDRVPRAVKLFLLTLAIVDDIGAILVVALFYSDGLGFLWLAGALAVVGLILVLRRLGVGSPLAYVVPAGALWLCMYESGVHATIAGVVLGLLTPANPFGGREVIEPLERRLLPWSSFLVIPLFALANAGVPITSATIDDAVGSRLAWGIAAGLVLGKPVGIGLATWLGARLRWGRLPAGVGARDVVAVGAVAGIGFTVSLFIADLSVEGAPLDTAKLAILTASVAAGALGALLLRFGARRRSARV